MHDNITQVKIRLKMNDEIKDLDLTIGRQEVWKIKCALL